MENIFYFASIRNEDNIIELTFIVIFKERNIEMPST